MITIREPRQRSPQRVQTRSDKRPLAQVRSYTAPTRGLFVNQELSRPVEKTALDMENFFPTARGLEPRAGTRLHATIAGGVESFMEYGRGFSDVFFAADASNIYQFDSAQVVGMSLTPVVTGQTSGDYSSAEIQNDAGTFLIAVNGADAMQIFDGGTWQQVTAFSTPFAITGVGSNRLSYVWQYRNRVFFIEKGTMNAWFLGINSVAGPAQQLPLSGVFNKGGSLLFGATWSTDSGAGMDDRAVFVTDQGEFAVYSGGDPADPNDWSLNGVYEIGYPLGTKAHIQVGGDLIVATEEGVTPLSAATSKDVTQLRLSALSAPIAPLIEQDVRVAGFSPDWLMVKWTEENRAILVPPIQSYCYPVNLETSAWTKFTGWEVSAMSQLGRGLFYGDANGNIYRCEIGGTDNGQPFTCRFTNHFDYLGSQASFKVSKNIRATWQYSTPIKPKLSLAGDYIIEYPTEPEPADQSQLDATLWDQALWDAFLWDNDLGDQTLVSEWISISRHGHSLAVQAQLVSNGEYAIEASLLAIDFTYVVGGVVV